MQFTLIPQTLLALALTQLSYCQSQTTTATSSGNAASTTPVSSFTQSTIILSSSGSATSTAHFPSLSGVSNCVSVCLSLAVGMAGCDSIVDVDCYCRSSRFASDYANCLASQCNSELSTGENLAEQFCNQASNSTSVSFPSPTASPSSSTNTLITPSTGSSSSTSSSSASSSSAPNGAIVAVAAAPWLGLAVTAAGIALGATFA